MIRKALFAIAATLSGCAEPPPPPVDGEIIQRAVKRAQDQVDAGHRAREAGNAAPIESEG